jgi:hypothetical protein
LWHESKEDRIEQKEETKVYRTSNAWTTFGDRKENLFTVFSTALLTA